MNLPNSHTVPHPGPEKSWSHTKGNLWNIITDSFWSCLNFLMSQMCGQDGTLLGSWGSFLLQLERRSKWQKPRASLRWTLAFPRLGEAGSDAWMGLWGAYPFSRSKPHRSQRAVENNVFLMSWLSVSDNLHLAQWRSEWVGKWKPFLSVKGATWSTKLMPSNLMERLSQDNICFLLTEAQQALILLL